MRGLINLKAVIVLLAVWATGTYGQEPHVKERARAFEPLMATAARKYGVDPHILWTIAYQETRFQPSLISPKGARGLMQFMPATAARYGLQNPHDPRQAIEAAARYVSDLSRRFNGDKRLVLAAYNSGEGTVEAFRDGRRLVLSNGKIINSTFLKTGGVPPYRETQSYVINGTAIHRNITLANIFNTAPRLDKLQLTVAVKPDDVAEHLVEPERSIYINVADKDSPPVQATVRTHSIYIP